MMTMRAAGSPGIVGNEALTKDNYEKWSVLMKNYLMGRGLWDVVESNSPPPPPSSLPEKPSFRKWKMQNASALHIIQLSCTSDTFAQIRRLQTAKEAWNHLSASFGSNLQADIDIEQGGVMEGDPKARKLFRNVEENDWNAVKSILNKDDMAIYSTVLNSGRTVLHVAAIAGHQEMVKHLVGEGGERLLTKQDNRGYTALALAADLTGNRSIAKCMVEESSVLLSIKTKEGEIPLLLAAAMGHKKMTRYLYSVTPSSLLLNDNARNAVLLLSRCITAEIFDVALKLLQQHGDVLPLTHESESLRPLKALVHMPSAFPSGTTFGILQWLCYDFLKVNIEIGSSVPLDKGPSMKTFAGLYYPWHALFAGRLFKSVHRFILRTPFGQILGQLLSFLRLSIQNSVLLKFSGIKEIYKKKKTHHRVYQIMSCLRKRVACLNGSELRDASAYDAMLKAAKYGITEFIEWMRKANPDLLWATDRNKRGIFSHAILNRKENVFNLIHAVHGRKEIVVSRTDAFGNNLLHLAAQLGPSSALADRSGAALQMQSEIQWFKAVEEIVHPKCKEAKNEDGKKPREIFTEQHDELAKAGEKWAKDTAGAFSIVGTLITTILFAAAFTLPGGNNQSTGEPMFLYDKAFTVFIVADALSLFASSTSVLIFIGILTSRYAEIDFLQVLPWKLLAALVALFLSVVSMMVAFCAALLAMLKGKAYHPLLVGAMVLASIPVMVFIPSQLRLFLEIFGSTTRSNVCTSTKKGNAIH
ncbi:hypothetical protein PIB30_001828 [Stylosanthes scabra]|uniref:PGG domain-containing protein n=1 Tax=Stylosanthes scabra TaxID=79078 RepID=A0ABU6W0W6_9FABA|nr:hypothetical protein [Stylosanthes scabra]